MSDKRFPRYLPIDRSQNVLLPLDVDRLIDDNHVARRIWRVVDSLDLSRFEHDIRAVEGVAGRPPHSPQVLISVWLYAFTRGLHSAREIERQMDYEPALRWLTGLRPIKRGSDLFDAHRCRTILELLAVDPISIAQQESRSRLPGKCLSNLLCGPLRRRMSGDIEMQDSAAIVRQYDEDE